MLDFAQISQVGFSLKSYLLSIKKPHNLIFSIKK